MRLKTSNILQKKKEKIGEPGNMTILTIHKGGGGGGVGRGGRESTSAMPKQFKCIKFPP